MARLPGPSWEPGQWLKIEEGSPNQAYPLTELSGGGNASPLSILQSLLGPYVLQNYTLTCAAVSLTVNPQAATLSKVSLGGGGEASPLLILGSLFGSSSGIVANVIPLTLAVQDTILRTGRFVAGGTVAMTVSPQAATLTKTSAGAGAGDPAPLLILSTLLQANSANKFLPSSTVSLVVTPQAANLAKGKSLRCDTMTYTVSIAPGQIDAQLTADAISMAVSVKDAAIYRPVIIPLTASTFSMAVTVMAASLVKQGTDKTLVAGQIPPMSVTIRDAGSLRDYVLAADGIFYTASIKAAFMPGERDPNAVSDDRPAGGYVRRKRFHLRPQTEDEFYEALLSAEQADREKKRLAELPVKAKRAATKVIEQAVDGISRAQAAHLAAAYLHEPMKVKLEDRARKTFEDEKARWNDAYLSIMHGLILEQLRKAADKELLDRLIAEHAAEQAEFEEVMDAWGVFESMTHL